MDAVKNVAEEIVEKVKTSHNKCAVELLFDDVDFHYSTQLVIIFFVMKTTVKYSGISTTANSIKNEMFNMKNKIVKNNIVGGSIYSSKSNAMVKCYRCKQTNKQTPVEISDN